MNNTTYYVCHGPDVVHYVELEQGSAFKSGQPNIQQFDNEQEGKARAEELGYVFPTEEEIN
jgi:hypothetical protein